MLNKGTDISDEAKRSEGFFPGRSNSGIRKLPGLLSCLDDTIILSELEIGIHIATLLHVLINFSCVHASYITGFKLPHFSKEGKKQFKNRDFSCCWEKNCEQRNQNELLEIPCFKWENKAQQLKVPHYSTWAFPTPIQSLLVVDVPCRADAQQLQLQ